jgi:hypothetical protein
MPAAGIPLGDILTDSGYAHRDAAAWALPLRAAGARLVQDLHPHDHDRKTAELAPWRTASSGASQPTTKTATTGSSAPPPWPRSAARSARHR